ncbi:MAG: NYN domain-containing protein [Ilumatobacteraceae bacterium]
MTTTSAAHYVVDGSNIATEGRSRPSLEQLQEAVTTFMADHPDSMITVVVDATFGHRIDPSEKNEFDEAIANNELVAPPAGAIGRGDAFVLTIADRAGASVLSNDSFQEFHGDYEWLFDEGRLVGGKPVPHVGWVFVARTPVRGPVSRKATKKSSPAAPAKPSRRTASKQASQPMPVPTSPPPGAAKRSNNSAAKVKAEGVAPKGGDPVNELMPFLDFVETSPVGTRRVGQVERFASHGAYVRVGDVSVYVSLRLMADPPPKSARAQVKIGEEVGVTIVGFVAERRSIDGAFDAVSPTAVAGISGEQPDEKRRTTSATHPRRVAATKKSAGKKTPSKASSAAKSTATKETAASASTKKTAARKVSAKTPANKTSAKKVATAVTAETKKPPAKKAPAKKAPAKTSPAKKVSATKAAMKKSPAPQTARKKVATTSRTRKAESA